MTVQKAATGQPNQKGRDLVEWRNIACSLVGGNEDRPPPERETESSSKTRALNPSLNHSTISHNDVHGINVIKVGSNSIKIAKESECRQFAYNRETGRQKKIKQRIISHGETVWGASWGRNQSPTQSYG